MACLVGGSQAGPCKPSSRIIESSIASDTSTTVGSTTTSSFVDTTMVAASSTVTSNEESSVIITELSSTETSQSPEETSTTALSTTDGITTEIATTTEAATPTNTATTSEVPSAIPFITNAGFDDDTSSIAPWELFNGLEVTVSIASDVKHDGRNSALFTQGQRPLIDFIRQPLRGSITAGVAYTMSAWVNANLFCPAVELICSYQNTYWEETDAIDLTTSVDEWKHVTSTCTYTQEQIDSGDLYFMIGFHCIGNGGRGYIDTVDFAAI
ncbi:uncharacterized protein FFB14_08721 [Fusarium fujikuroi]|nr:uncharacterized protein FFB14_08721 [Fusarium fujikuroi]